MFLPMFPLQLVVFPGEDLNLHIFEPRYRQLIHDCTEGKKTFGIPCFLSRKVQEIGTEVELLGIEKKYPGGEMDVRTRGIGLFRIRQFYRKAPEKLYGGAEVISQAFSTEGDPVSAQKIRVLVGELFKLMKVDRPFTDREGRVLPTFAMGHYVGFSLDQEYHLLTLPEETQRQRYLLEHLERVLPTVREMEKMRQRVQMNGHFRNIRPPRI